MNLNKQIFEFSLTNGKRAKINVPALLNKTDIQILKKQLDVMELQTKTKLKQDQRNELKKRRLKKVALNRITM
ncbi:MULTISPECIES: hypothetical protein [Bacillus amyloliquefaciens group]|uniref:hypothetical protein n=1 Tax=Bacillus amyloliquefaciens group TaxID=1938374 RepID=UPI0022714958|nr:hypothetical protein [Bacillus velezensis]MCY0092232.1 hypothetical protein [Bacillus velezensis]